MNPSSPASDETPRARPLGCFKWLFLTSLAALTILGIVGLKSCGAMMSRFKQVTDFVASLPDKFQSQQITQTFRESLIRITPTHGDVLELATAERDETLTRYDMKALFNTVYLGTSVAEIRVPAVYRYHLKLSEEWRLGSSGHTCVVIAPIIRPSLPPAIRTERMEKRSESGWMRFNAAHNLAELEKSITPTLEKRAGNATHIDEVREAARKSVAEFVKVWLVKEEQWKQQGFTSIVIVFADEPAGKAIPEAAQQPPTLNLVP